MGNTDLKLSVVGAEPEGEHFRVDYLPFGVKTLKVRVEGDYGGKLRPAAEEHGRDRQAVGREDMTFGSLCRANLRKSGFVQGRKLRQCSVS